MKFFNILDDYKIKTTYTNIKNQNYLLLYIYELLLSFFMLF